MRSCWKFARRAPFPVTFTQNEHRLGFAENFLALAQTAVGPLLAFCDQDDVWHPAKLERARAWFHDPEVGLVLHRNLLVDESLRSRGQRFPPIRRTEIRGPRRVDPDSLARAWPSSSGAPSSTRSRDERGHHRGTWTAILWTMTNGPISSRPLWAARSFSRRIWPPTDSIFRATWAPPQLACVNRSSEACGTVRATTCGRAPRCSRRWPTFGMPSPWIADGLVPLQIEPPHRRFGIAAWPRANLLGRASMTPA